ncbi:MAG: extracellular solute-binding protein, partial [bacterium]|nr:extracellular solute-binding protein [bacterium]
MKLMKKSLILLLSTFALVGCGGKGSESAEEHDVEVIWWNNYEVPKKGDNEEEARKKSNYREYYYAKDLIAAFEAENPHIKITTAYQGDYSDIAKAVKAGIDTGNIPTIASTYQDNVATYVDAEVSYDMSEFAKELEKDSDFNK